MNTKAIIPHFLLALLISLAGCKSESRQEQSQSYPAIKASSRPVEITESYSASIQGRQDIDIYPQVAGKIARLCVKEGERVGKGTTLFVIDQVPYQAALRTAIANVRAAEAQVETARLDYTSKQELFKENVISEYDLSMAKNALAVANAALEQAKAHEVDAQNSLSYTEVKSPADGTVGTLPFRVGSLVGPDMPRPLTSVSDNNEMYVYFSMTENQLRTLVRQYGSPEETIKQMPSVALQLNDGSRYDAGGRIETISGMVNDKTGTLQVRAIFPNDKKLLWSGGIGNIIIPRTIDNAIVIPRSATVELQDKMMVYRVVDGKTSATFIKVLQLNDGKNYVVTEGLSAGDVIVSEGAGLLQDGMEITIKE